MRGCLRHVYKLPNFSEELQATLIFRTDRCGLFSGYFLGVLGHSQNEPDKLCLPVNFVWWHYFLVPCHLLLLQNRHHDYNSSGIPIPDPSISAFHISSEKGNQFHLCPQTKVLWSISLSLHVIITFAHSNTSPVLSLVPKAGSWASYQTSAAPSSFSFFSQSPCTVTPWHTVSFASVQRALGPFA